jgi:hypothetical protein
MTQPTRARKPNGNLLGSYRIATAPEPNSSRLTSLKSTCFDGPANNCLYRHEFGSFSDARVGRRF